MPGAGRLEVICGPMFAGKTTELMRRLQEAQKQGAKVRAIKPARDTRYRAVELATHNGQHFPAIPVGEAAEIIAAVGDAASGGGVVGIDEIHFFGEALVPVCIGLVNMGARVIVSGVERNHRGEPFQPFPYLLCEADEVIKLSGTCAVCGGPSVHSQRMTASNAHIEVGGADKYQPRCRACFEPPRPA